MMGYTQQFEKMADAQKEFFEPMRKMNEFAICAFEKMARHNHEVAGDFVDYAVEQTRAAAEVDGISGLFDQQLAATQSFADLVGKRSGEYTVMSRDMINECQEAVKLNIMEPAQRAGEKYNEVAKDFQDGIKESFQSAGAAAKSATPRRAKSAKN